MKFSPATRRTTTIGGNTSASYAASFYGLLKVPVAAALTQIEESFRTLAEQQHPDVIMRSAAARKRHAQCTIAGGPCLDCPVCEATVDFARLTEARAVLRDVKLRKQYDMKLQLAGLEWCNGCGGRGQQKVGFKNEQRKPCRHCNGTGSTTP